MGFVVYFKIYNHCSFHDVTLLDAPILLHLARPAGSTYALIDYVSLGHSRNVLDNQSMRERCWLGKRGQLFSLITAKVKTAESVTLCPGQAEFLSFSQYNRGLIIIGIVMHY